MSVESFRYCEEAREESVYESMTSMVSTYLVGEDECAEEDALIGPLLEGNLDVGLCALDVDEGNEEGGDLDLCLRKDVCEELEELVVLGCVNMERPREEIDEGRPSV